jgi:hypothetical protein
MDFLPTVRITLNYIYKQASRGSDSQFMPRTTAVAIVTESCDLPVHMKELKFGRIQNLTKVTMMQISYKDKLYRVPLVFSVRKPLAQYLVQNRCLRNSCHSSSPEL